MPTASDVFALLSSFGRNHSEWIQRLKRSSTSCLLTSSGTSDSGRRAFLFASCASTFDEPQ